MKVKCRICGYTMDSENPFVFRDRNPLTFRIAWMHADCFNNACEQMMEIPASNDAFENRYEEFEFEYLR